MLFKRFKYITILAVTAVFLLVGAFFLGTVVSADITGSPAPGSAEDPLVSESYVKAKVAALEARIAELEQQVAGTSSTNSSKGNSSSSSNSVSGSNNNSSNSSSNNSSNSSSTGGSSANQPTSPSAKMVQIKQLSTYANVRSTPNMQAQVMIRVNPGSQLTWLKTSGDWYNVRLSDGRSGWVHNSVAELR
jgi:hypothetical protein